MRSRHTLPHARKEDLIPRMWCCRLVSTPWGPSQALQMLIGIATSRSDWAIPNKYDFKFTDFPEHHNVNIQQPLSCTRLLRWQRTISPAANTPEAARLSLRNYRLIDQRDKTVVAEFMLSTLYNVRTRAKLQLLEMFSPIFEALIVLTCVSIAEKSTRACSIWNGTFLQ